MKRDPEQILVWKVIFWTLLLTVVFAILYRYASTHGSGVGGQDSLHQRPID